MAVALLKYDDNLFNDDKRSEQLCTNSKNPLPKSPLRVPNPEKLSLAMPSLCARTIGVLSEWDQMEEIGSEATVGVTWVCTITAVTQGFEDGDSGDMWWQWWHVKSIRIMCEIHVKYMWPHSKSGALLWTLSPSYAPPELSSPAAGLALQRWVQLPREDGRHRGALAQVRTGAAGRASLNFLRCPRTSYDVLGPTRCSNFPNLLPLFYMKRK